jgi:hypothetical protein
VSCSSVGGRNATAVTLQAKLMDAAATKNDSMELDTTFPCNRTRTLSCSSMYAKVEVSFSETTADVTETLYRDAITAALRSLHGAIGGAVPFEILRVWPSGVGIVKLSAEDFSKFHASLTCMNDYDGHECSLRLQASSPFLASLAVDSRQFALSLNLD